MGYSSLIFCGFHVKLSGVKIEEKVLNNLKIEYLTFFDLVLPKTVEMISVCYCIFQRKKVVIHTLSSDAKFLVAVSQDVGSVIQMMIVVTTLMSRIVVSK